ncbi:MAG: hypothetical protein ACAH95_13910 [Fimbriimonas sp.]
MNLTRKALEELCYENGFNEWDQREVMESFIESRGLGEELAHYIKETVVANPSRCYSKEFGDDRQCKCGHPYYRHFDSYERMSPVGCKYCGCRRFDEWYGNLSLETVIVHHQEKQFPYEAPEGHVFMPRRAAWDDTQFLMVLPNGDLAVAYLDELDQEPEAETIVTSPYREALKAMTDEDLSATDYGLWPVADLIYERYAVLAS